MIKLFASDPAFIKIDELTRLLGCAINRWPFTPYRFMPELELNIEIEAIREQIENEFVLIERSISNFLN